MRRSLFAVLGASMLALAPSLMSGQARFGLAGGFAAPVSVLAQDANPGFNVAAGLNFGGTHVPIGARVEGAFNGFTLKEFNDHVRILDLTVNAIANVGQRPTSPYLIGGLGLYNSKVAARDSKNALGMNIGGGLRFPVGDMTTFFEARYHLMFGNRTDLANYQFIPISFGVVF